MADFFDQLTTALSTTETMAERAARLEELLDAQYGVAAEPQSQPASSQASDLEPPEGGWPTEEEYNRIRRDIENAANDLNWKQWLLLLQKLKDILTLVT